MQLVRVLDAAASTATAIAQGTTLLHLLSSWLAILTLYSLMNSLSRKLSLYCFFSAKGSWKRYKRLQHSIVAVTQLVQRGMPACLYIHGCGKDAQ